MATRCPTGYRASRRTEERGHDNDSVPVLAARSPCCGVLVPRCPARPRRRSARHPVRGPQQRRRAGDQRARHERRAARTRADHRDDHHDRPGAGARPRRQPAEPQLQHARPHRGDRPWPAAGQRRRRRLRGGDVRRAAARRCGSPSGHRPRTRTRASTWTSCWRRGPTTSSRPRQGGRPGGRHRPRHGAMVASEAHTEGVLRELALTVQGRGLAQAAQRCWPPPRRSTRCAPTSAISSPTRCAAADRRSTSA